MCLIPTPWLNDEDDKKRSASETEEEEGIIPTKKRTRKLSDSSPEKESTPKKAQQSMYKDFSSPETQIRSPHLLRRDQIQNGQEVTRVMMIPILTRAVKEIILVLEEFRSLLLSIL